MEELTQILLAHAARYPKMEPRDAVKLIYQNEFGGGHLIRDAESCLAYLQREYESVIQSSGDLVEDIGNGLVRVSLAALDAHGYTPEQLGRDFIRSATIHTGSPDRFLAKLELLRQLTRAGGLPFPFAGLESYLAEYAAAGYPMVSHSEAYRTAYAPAYRILLRSGISASRSFSPFTESLPPVVESFIASFGKI